MLSNILKLCVEKKGSDIHLVPGAPPGIRVEGKVLSLNTGALTKENCKKMIYSVMTEEQRSSLEEKKTIDFSFGVKGVSRFRANVFYEKNQIAACFRRVEDTIPSLEKLNLSHLARLVDTLNGLILVTGPTGSGKTTSIVSLIDFININSQSRIITLEDPIEYVFHHKNSFVSQREVGKDVPSFEEGFKYMMRQDPDVCFVGELRDKTSVEVALDLAQTGHLVFATLHTNSAVETINRIISSFPPAEKEAVLNYLSFTLKAVVSQRLLNRKQGGRVACLEILRSNSSVKNLIRSGKIHQIYSSMQTGQSESGMITFNQSLSDLVKKGVITEEEAYKNCSDPKELTRLLGGSL